MEIREFEFDGPIVAVHAHPDDETLTSGALLAQCVERGVPVTLVTCTRGEQGEVIGSDPLGLEGNGPALGEYRERELAHAMDALGVTDHLFLDQIRLISDDAAGLVGSRAVRYMDSGMSWVNGELGDGASGAAQLPQDVSPDAFYFSDLEIAAQRLAQVVTQRGARIVCTYEPGGGYGHPDHVRAYEVAKRAVDLVNASGAGTVRLLSAIVPASFARQSRTQLVEVVGNQRADVVAAGGVLPSINGGFASIAAYEPNLVFSVSLSGVADKILEAMKAHETQIQWAQLFEPSESSAEGQVIGFYALSNNIIAPILNREYYAEI